MTLKNTLIKVSDRDYLADTKISEKFYDYVIVITKSAYDTDKGKLHDSRENNVLKNGKKKCPRRIDIVNVSFNCT